MSDDRTIPFSEVELLDEEFWSPAEELLSELTAGAASLFTDEDG